MKLERYPLHLFGDQEQKEEINILVPQGSKLVSAKVIHDGIYVWYAVPELEVPQDQKETFIILKPNQSIPENATFVDILDVIVETPQGQGIMIFPVYKSNSLIETALKRF